MVKRSWRSLLAGVAIFGGIGAVNTAFAGGGGCTPCGDSYCPSCQQCDQIFADAGQKLTDQLASMSCCGTCGDPGCGGCGTTHCFTADDLCGDAACGEGCGAMAEDEGGGIDIGGWIQMGYHNKPTPNSTTPFDAGSFNSHPNRFNLHQGWLYAEKVADGSEGLDWGFRGDLMYGVDAADTQSFGNNPGRWDINNSFQHGQYGWAIPQLYAEVAAGDWSVKAGHFYTLVGYEVVTAPDNFFYSHALTMFNSEPFTHTGVLATYSASDDVSVYAGWTAGWDTGFDRLNGGSNFLGGFSTALGDDLTFTYIGYGGNLGWRGDGYGHSLVFDFTLTEKLNYILQSDLVRTNNGDADLTTVGDRDDDLGINQYLIYRVSDQLGVGTRMEWWKNEGVSQYAATFGINVTPMENLVIRPEVRYDWNRSGQPGFVDQTTFGVDAIVTF